MEEAVIRLYTALMVMSTLGSVCGNLVLLLVLFLNKDLRTDTCGLTLSFCLSDLALGISTIPFGAYNSLFQPDGYPSEGALCQGSGFLFVLLQLASIHSLTWATIDKFTEICFALNYPSMCTARRTRGVLVLIWIYCLVNAALPLLGFGSYGYSTNKFICAPCFGPWNKGLNVCFIVVGIIAPIVIMCCLYGYIVYIARKQVRRGTFVCNDQHCFYVPANNYFRSSIVMVATAVCLLVCWLPYITMCFYETFTGNECPGAASALATWLGLSTAALNPWVNSMTQARYREALKKTFWKLQQVFRRSEKTSRPQSTAVPLEVVSNSSRESSSPRASSMLSPQTALSYPPEARSEDSTPGFNTDAGLGSVLELEAGSKGCKNTHPHMDSQTAGEPYGQSTELGNKQDFHRADFDGTQEV
ncbi:histamine H2 receptor [Aplochiton taeniatus]